jgi:hypothetical protein
MKHANPATLRSGWWQPLAFKVSRPSTWRFLRW